MLVKQKVKTEHFFSTILARMLKRWEQQEP